MSEYTERRWKCDYCGKSVKYIAPHPAGWSEVRLDIYGNTTHCCSEYECEVDCKAFVKENYPSAFASAAWLSKTRPCIYEET